MEMGLWADTHTQNQSSGMISIGHYLPHGGSCPKAPGAKLLFLYRAPRHKWERTGRSDGPSQEQYLHPAYYLNQALYLDPSKFLVKKTATWFPYHFWETSRPKPGVFSLILFADFCSAVSIRCSSSNIISSVSVDSFNNLRKGNLKSTLLNFHQLHCL